MSSPNGEPLRKGFKLSLNREPLKVPNDHREWKALMKRIEELEALVDELRNPLPAPETGDGVYEVPARWVRY